MEPLYFECHLFDRQTDEKVIIYRITQERVMDHTLYVLKCADDVEASEKPKWKASGSYHYFDQVVKEVYRILSRMEEEKGITRRGTETDFVSYVNNKIENKSNYLFIRGTSKSKKPLQHLPDGNDWIDFSTMKELSKA
jgi:hypothetical protein